MMFIARVSASCDQYTGYVETHNTSILRIIVAARIEQRNEVFTVLSAD